LSSEERRPRTLSPLLKPKASSPSQSL
jgi:hypothetical protein